MKIPKLAADSRRIWNASQIRDFVVQTKAPWGEGWRLLSAEMQENAITARAFHVAVGQHREEIPREAMECLLLDMTIAAGLRTEEEATRPNAD